MYLKSEFIISTKSGIVAQTVQKPQFVNGFLPCDGRTVSKSLYPELWASIGGAYGSTTATFNLPDLRGHTLISTDESDPNYLDYLEQITRPEEWDA